ncbi:ABC transporter substrate-binding protein [Rhodoblastus acidophilus]|uniref:ABC transporter substrate-binding protein n=1 Tax=Candidatus Rhodoblastus alkanivorans TaxID=2954117 RepID=A0ABS9Z5E0_9HYPH|nr:ABC transporter substrate-binding protein [Candidatus Rhodoblastus alkanivorans]MCI4678485.1 ABC transporter substrate-binding protein [Candidatus Rhodoblastus alkanivorans]MCI4682841.1 ABC transporter substrate-binding protein [Candidatus Rhodoblastus alkanivorans]MDI4640151.1 ABC transporter substrate-binding protein [Rhodoblastus acidophilus]
MFFVAPPAWALDRVVFASNWLAQAEHGGFYQAVEDGTYAKYGLDVKIVPGGPERNNRLLLAAGRADFYMGDNLIGEFSALAENIPIVTVAAIFQKDPLVFMSHPGAGLDRFEDLPKADKAFVGLATLTTVWPWMEKEWGFRRDRVATYNFNSAPFIADKHSIEQGYLTSEPFAIARSGGFKPNVFLLADHGYDTYATTIETRRDLLEKNPDLVRRFVEASILGWVHYLHGDNRAANALIKRENPDMDDAQIAFSFQQMKAHGIVESGDALTRGIGAMDSARIARFYHEMAAAGAAPAGLDLALGFDYSFVNKGLGLEGLSRN